MTEIKNIYENLINGTYKNYSDLVKVVSKLSNLIPELDINTSGGIDNFT